MQGSTLRSYCNMQPMCSPLWPMRKRSHPGMCTVPEIFSRHVNGRHYVAYRCSSAERRTDGAVTVDGITPWMTRHSRHPIFLHLYSLTSHLIPIPGAASSLCRPQLLRHQSSCTLPTCSVVYGADQPKYSLTASSRSGYYNVTYLVERGNSQSEEEDWHTPHNSATLTPS